MQLFGEVGRVQPASPRAGELVWLVAWCLFHTRIGIGTMCNIHRIGIQFMKPYPGENR